MRDYAQLRPRFWIQGTGKELRGDHEARLVALYLASAPTSNLIGLYYLPIHSIAHEVGLTPEGAMEALDRVCATGFARYDEVSEYVWVVNMAREQVGEDPKKTDNRIAGVRNELKKHDKCPFYADFCAYYADAFGLPKPAPSTPPSEAPSKPLEGARESGSRTGSRTGTGNSHARAQAREGAAPPAGSYVEPPIGENPAEPELEPGEPEPDPPERTGTTPTHRFEFEENLRAEYAKADVGLMPRLKPAELTNALEHCRDIERNYSKPLGDVARAVCRAAEPGSKYWVINLARVDPYAPQRAPPRPANGNARQRMPMARGTTGKDFEDEPDLDEQLAALRAREVSNGR